MEPIMLNSPHPIANRLESGSATYFAQGNYTNAALTSTSDTWLHHAALALIGHPDAAAALEDFQNSEEARFYRGVALWIQGKDDQALSVLHTVDTEHAHRLCTEISKPLIPVLIQSPWGLKNAVFYDALSDRKFRVFGIGPIEGAKACKPYADVREYYPQSMTPLFFYSIMAEWHALPANLPQASFPSFVRTSDFDMHVQMLLPWLEQCDAILTHCGTEHQQLSPLISRPVFTFPKSFGLTSSLPPFPQVDRDLDLAFTGTVLDAYHPDKWELLAPLMQLSDLKLRLIPRFLPEPAYFQLLARSRLAVSYVRWTAGWTTRALEALAMGCFTLVQEKSILTLFFKPEEGVGTYDFAKHNLSEMVNSYSRRDATPLLNAARSGATKTRTQWNAATTISQTLRFLTVLATNPNLKRVQGKELQSRAIPLQKRPVLSKGWIYHSTLFQQDMFQASVEKCYSALSQSPSPSDIIDLLREVALAKAARQLSSPAPIVTPQLFNEILELSRQGLEIFPRSLVLRFNYIRVVLHHGRPKDVDHGLSVLIHTLTRNPLEWEVKPMEDVLPWDYMPELFDYRIYFDEVCRVIAEKSSDTTSLKQLIYASLYRYLSAYSDSLNDFRQMSAITPTTAGISLPMRSG